MKKLLQRTKVTVTAHKDGALLKSTADPNTAARKLARLRVVSQLPYGMSCAWPQAATLDDWASSSGRAPVAVTFDERTLQVIVTASKRREELSKTGISMSAVSGEELEDRSANSLQDYLAFIPGVSLESGGTPGFGEVSIRGIAAAASVQPWRPTSMVCHSDRPVR